MTDKVNPLFLERRSYRQRRLMDAARLLPVLGIVLWLVPLLWPRDDGDVAGVQTATSTSSAVLYIFGVWICLAIASLLLSVMLEIKGDRTAERTR